MTYQLIINNRVEEMAKLEPFIVQISDAFGIAPDTAFQLNLALDEALSNAVNYAYGDGQGEIVLEASKACGYIEFHLTDSGAPFDPTNEGENVDITSSAEERPIGGLGIFLIKQMMDEVLYEHRDGKNILIMKKKI